MGTVNSIPIVSQIKSFIQWIFGDTDGAKETQEDFVQECPIISQVTSMVQLIEGDVNGAVKTQKRFVNALLNAVNGLPIVGHVIGAIQYARGYKEEGKRIMIRATRTTAVLGAGAVGFTLGIPVLAVCAGMLFDLGATIIGEPSGYFAAFANIDENLNAGDCFDILSLLVCDGLTGYTGCTLASSYGATPLKVSPTPLSSFDLDYLLFANRY